MSIDQNKDLVRRFNEAMRTHNLDLLDEVFAPSYVSHNHTTPNGEVVKLAELKQAIAYFNAAFPDAHVIDEDIIAAGDRIVHRMSLEATHTGPFMGIPATGKRIRWTGIDIWRIAGGKVVEQWSERDRLAMQQQLRPQTEPAGTLG